MTLKPKFQDNRQNFFFFKEKEKEKSKNGLDKEIIFELFRKLNCEVLDIMLLVHRE